ncbi:MAG: RNA 2'-phosphotransferase, partial [Caldilineaceae bacterium]|nr:RNA 2'-phosphotransferase [Caldilineaceae bacterium]
MHEATAKQITRFSKLLSLILRHDPGRIGLTLDAGGWADVDELLTKAAQAGHKISREQLAAVVAQNNKQRFRFNEDGTRIRANQGHSIPVDLGLEAQTPPPVLYHGTATRFLDSIRAEGLNRRSRQHVHLSADIETARKVGQRHGKPVILTVDAAAMHGDGHTFYRSDNGVWLVDAVPTAYLMFPDS